MTLLHSMIRTPGGKDSHAFFETDDSCPHISDHGRATGEPYHVFRSEMKAKPLAEENLKASLKFALLRCGKHVAEAPRLKSGQSGRVVTWEGFDGEALLIDCGEQLILATLVTPIAGL